MLLMNKSIFACVLLGVICISGSAYAVGCEDESEELARLGEDKYFALNPSAKLNSKDLRILEGYYEVMEGEWRGTYVYRTCVRSRDKIKTAKVVTEISKKSAGVIKIRSDADYSDDRSGIFTRDNLGEEYIYFLENKDNGELVFSERYRRGAGDRGAVLIENVYRLNVEKGNIKINMVEYINGYFAAEEAWSLTRE